MACRQGSLLDPKAKGQVSDGPKSPVHDIFEAVYTNFCAIFAHTEPIIPNEIKVYAKLQSIKNGGNHPKQLDLAAEKPRASA